MPDLDMSPYGLFVWSAYGISALALGALVAAIAGRARAVSRRLAALEAAR